VGVTGLYLSGALNLQQYGLTWWTWWVGDSIGTLVFTPLTLAWLAHGGRPDRRGRLAITLPLVLLFAATVALFVRANSWEAERARLAFNAQAHEAADRVSQNVVTYVRIAEAAAAMMEVSPGTDRDAFARFAKRLWQPGVKAVEWAPIVPLAERAAYEGRAREDGLSGFTFTEVQDGVRRPAGRRDDYAPVYYVEPLDGNRPAVGFDLLSNASRRSALERAAGTRQSVVTEPVTLVQETGSQRGFLVAAPAFGAAQRDAQEGRLLGYAIGVFRIGDIVSFSLRSIRSAHFALAIDDVTKPGPPATLHAPAAADTGAMSHAQTLDVGGRRWRMTFTPTARFWAGRSRRQAWGVLAAGFLFTGLVGVLLAVMTGRAGRMEQLVEERTSQLVQADIALRDRSAHLEAVHDAAVDGIITVDAQGDVVSANPAAGTVFHATADGLRGMPLTDAVAAVEADDIARWLAEVIGGVAAEETPPRREVTGARADGVEFPMEICIARLDGGDRPMALCIVRDVSERHEVERIKEEFVATVSHELRTPVSAVKAALDLINMGHTGDIPEQAMAMVDIAGRNTNRMLRLVEDILALQSLESGGMQFARETVDVRAVVEQAVEANTPYARTYGVTVLLEDSAGPALATTDPVRAGQVVVNLLSNAVKFSPADRPVRVDVRARGAAIRTTVVDEGPGIPEAARDTIFERFQQLDGASTRERDGSGLGLAISRAMTEKLNGALDFHSVVGQGTTFYLDLPAVDG